MTVPPPPKRSAEIVTHIAAPVDAIWKALTDAEELTRWFPLEARVKPGAGGSIFTSWRNEHQWESPISVWEPNLHLQVLWCPAETPVPERFGVDYFLHAQEDGTTVLRLVHFGFGVEAKWDEMYDGVSRGWSHMIWILKHYLERHRGEPRHVVHVRAPLEESRRDEVWARFFSKDGLFPDRSLLDAGPGQPFRLRLTTGEEVAGTVRSNLPGKNFDAKIPPLGDSLLNVQIHRRMGGDGFLLQVTLSTFGLPRDRVERMGASWQDAVDRAASPEGSKS